MKKIAVFLMIFISGVNLYSMQKQAEVHHVLETIVSEGTLEEARRCISTLDRSALNQLDFSIRVTVDFVAYEGFSVHKTEYQSGFSLLHFVIAKNKYDLIKFLHERGADLTLKSSPKSGSKTPLRLAYEKGRWKCIQALLEAGVSSKNDPFVEELKCIVKKNPPASLKVVQLLRIPSKL